MVCSSCCVCRAVRIACGVCSLVVIVVIVLSRIWESHLLLYKIHLIVSYSCFLSVSLRGYEIRRLEK